MHRRLIEDLHLAVSVFMTGDARAARNLVDEKVAMRDLERAATENHLARLREGRRETVETSALHLDILRDLKRIASHLAAVAYPILDQNGALRRSRLLDEEASPVQPASDAILRPTR
jgi:phosphate:Na+ symporter